MRSKIFLYLFIFTLMFTIFIYVNDKKILDAKEAQIENLEDKIARVEASNKNITDDNQRLQYFSLERNEEAISYFEERGIDASQLAQVVEDEIIGRNTAASDNELIPYSGMEGVMRINKIKILNHKWIIADFTDGTYWGELFIIYDIDDNNNLILNTEKAFLYPAD